MKLPALFVYLLLCLSAPSADKLIVPPQTLGLTAFSITRKSKTGGWLEEIFLRNPTATAVEFYSIEVLSPPASEMIPQFEESWSRAAAGTGGAKLRKLPGGEIVLLYSRRISTRPAAGRMGRILLKAVPGTVLADVECPRLNSVGFEDL